VFLTIVIGVIAALRPLLKAIHLPYFGRVSVILSAVAAIMVIAVLFGPWLKIEAMRGVVYFPVVVLCLAGEGFARTLSKEGLRSATWRGTMTALVAVLITLLSQMPALEHLLLRFPELLVAQVACIVVISEFLDLRLLQGLNPAPARPVAPVGSERKRRKGGQPARPHSVQSGLRDSRRVPVHAPAGDAGNGGQASKRNGDTRPAPADPGGEESGHILHGLDALA